MYCLYGIVVLKLPAKCIRLFIFNTYLCTVRQRIILETREYKMKCELLITDIEQLTVDSQ